MILIRYIPDAPGRRKWAVHITVINFVGKHPSKRLARYTLMTKAAARYCLEQATVGDLADVLLTGAQKYPWSIEEMSPFLKPPSANDH